MRRSLLVAVAPMLLAAMPTSSAAPAGGREISFREPVAFATGATPSSAEFNRVSGDQIGQVLLRAPLSDSVAVGDFNGDGRPDVAQTNVIAGSVSVFLGDGREGFAPPRLHAVGQHPVFVVAGDLDGNGTLDLAVADMGSNDVAILRGDGRGGFLPASFLPVPVPRNVAIADLNGDGIPDLAVASSAPAGVSPETPPQATTGGVAILTGTAAGTYVPTQFIATTAGNRPTNANYVSAGDFDGDGRADLAVGTGISSSAYVGQAAETQLTGDDVLIFRNQGGPLGTAAPLSAVPDQRIRVGAWPAAIAVVNLNGDAEPDLAVLNAASGDVTTLLGDGRGAFAVRARNVTVGANPRSLAVADLDEDGHLDLVTASFQASTVSVLAGDGDGTLQPAVDFWSGDAPTGVAVGDFDVDGRVDVVGGRLRDDHLVLLLNDSPRRGDGVVIERDIPYISAADDPFAARHTLDVYSPPPGTPSFAGSGRPYPVVFWAHGGGGISGDKSMSSFLMRSLAVEGIVAISTNYRLGWDVPTRVQVEDVAQAFRWTRDNVGSREYGGDPGNIFVLGTSAGAELVAGLATGDGYGAEQRDIRGLGLVGSAVGRPGNAAVLPPSLLLNGNEGLERALAVPSSSFAAASRERGAESTHVIVPGRDHVTTVSNLARTDDPGRSQLMSFLRKHLAVPADDPAAAAGVGEGAGLAMGQRGGTLPATGTTAGGAALGALLLATAAAAGAVLLRLGGPAVRVAGADSGRGSATAGVRRRLRRVRRRAWPPGRCGPCDRLGLRLSRGR